MTDKEIIINGIDVSGCEFAVKPINDNRIKCHCAKGLLQIAKMQEQPESIKSGLCENNPNCYYKQLKCKEQECEELKQWKKGAENLFKAQIDNTDKITNRYKQALDEIRQYRICEINDVDGEEDDVILGIIDEVMEP